MKGQYVCVVLFFFLFRFSFISVGQETRMSGTLTLHPWVNLPIINSNEAKGGFHQVANIADRNSIPATRRLAGMFCWVADDGNGNSKLYQLSGTNITDNATCWKEISTGIPVLSSAPVSPKLNDLYFNSSTNHLYKYSGTDWIPASIPYEGAVADVDLGVHGIKTESLRITGGSPQNGYVLTTDDSGNASWQPNVQNVSASTVVISGDLKASEDGTLTINDHTVSLTKLSDLGGQKLIGNPLSGSSAPSEISIGAGLSLSTDGTLSATVPDAATSDHAHSLDELSDVVIDANSTGEILLWDGTEWQNNTLAEAGIQPSGAYLQAADVAGKEDVGNKVTSFSSPTDSQYPSAKLVNDQLATKSDIAHTHSTYLSLTGGTMTGVLTTASNSSRGGLNLPHGAPPSSPSNGDLWTTTTGVFAQVSGATKSLGMPTFAASDAQKLLQVNDQGTDIEWNTPVIIGGDLTASEDGTLTINDHTVSLTKLSDLGGQKLIGNPLSGSSAPSEISIGAGLSLSTDGTLSATVPDAATSDHAHSLDELSDVVIDANSTGEILLWDGTEWQNNTLAEAGIQPSGAYLQAADVAGKEDVGNKVTSFSSPTDSQYPSAKLVNDQLATKSDIAHTHSTYLSLTGGTMTGVLTAASNSSRGGLNLPHGAPPSSPSNGDLWTTTTGVFAQVSGATQQLGLPQVTVSDANKVFQVNNQGNSVAWVSPLTVGGDVTVDETGTFTIAGSAVNSAKISDGTIVNADINSSAAIAGTKITPDFGSLPIKTTSTVTGSSFVSSSDSRLKQNVYTLSNVLDKINRLRGVSFEFIDQQKYASGPQIGLIAQELQQEYPELVSMGEDGFLQVNYSQLSAIVLEGVKQLNMKVVQMQEQITVLEKAFNKQQEKIEKIISFINGK